MANLPNNTEDAILLQIAGFIIKITFKKILDNGAHFDVKTNFKKIYKGFLYSAKPAQIDFTINLSDTVPTLVLKQKEKQFLFFYEETGDRSVISNSQMGWIHVSLLLKNILSKLLQSNGFILHGSASYINSHAAIFLGESGAGKSTITQLLKDTGTILADDSVIIKKENNEYYLYQTPFVEKNTVKRISKRYPLGCIMFLKKSTSCKLVRPNKMELVKPFLKQLYSDIHYYNADIKEALQFLSHVNNFYTLYFTKDKEVLKIFENLNLF